MITCAECYMTLVILEKLLCSPFWYDSPLNRVYKLFKKKKEMLGKVGACFFSGFFFFRDGENDLHKLLKEL